MATFEAPTGEAIAPNSVNIRRFDRNTDELILEYKEKEFRFPIEEDDFDRIFSWIENGGTGLFTAHRLTAQQRRSGGFSSAPRGYVAAEFSASKKLTKFALYLDFGVGVPPPFIGPPSEKLKLLETRNTRVQPLENGSKRDWITSDLDSKFVATLNAGKITMTGTVYAYFRRDSDSNKKVFVYDIKEFRDITSKDVEQSTMPLTQKAELLELHKSSLYFARSVALLRRLYVTDRKAWDAFADEYFEEEQEVLLK